MTISILKSTRVIYNVLSGKFNIVQIVSLNSPLLAWEWLHSKVALFFHSLLSSSPSSHGNRVQLFLHGCKVNEAVASPCSASYYRSLTQYSYFLMKKMLYSIISLTWVSERNVWSVIYLYWNLQTERHHLAFRGLLLAKWATLLL